MNSLRLQLLTASHLKPRQLAYLAKHRFMPNSHRLRCPVNIALRSGIRLAPSLQQVASGGDVNEFRFLNVSRVFPKGEVDWACSDMPKLWRYNLHYFDYLHDRHRSPRSVAALVSDWIDKNPIGTEDAWEPYTISLRIVNWVKWYLSADFTEIPWREWLESLYLQASWLEKHIEYHLLANHYLKNGKALFFAGVYFSGNDSEQWLHKGLKILREEAREQILEDGGHYERSPMYHCIVVEDYLDVLNLLTSNLGLVDLAIIDELRMRTVAALDFLNDIVGSDGQIPLFNDSAFGIARDPEALFAYARRIIGYKRPSRPHGLDLRSLPATGYYTIRESEDMLIVDCGSIGPDYQPGHAHCDTLSYELYLDGRRVVVDAGVHDYEPSEARSYARSTRAHNTVEVDGKEQSEVWGVFRVARRAKPIKAILKKVDKNRVLFEGAHDGYHRIPGRVTHQRRIEYESNKAWTIIDELQGNGKHQVESFIHLAPDLCLHREFDGVMDVCDADSGAELAQIVLPDNLQAEIIESSYFPEFGIKQANEGIRLHGEVYLPFTTSYTIRKTSSAA